MAKPAASSAAELMRLPVDNRSMIPFIARSFLFNELAVTIAAEFELITDISESPLKVKLGKKSLFKNLSTPLLSLFIVSKRQTFTKRREKDYGYSSRSFCASLAGDLKMIPVL